MPTVDGEYKVVGTLLRENKDTGNFIRSYMVLDFSTHNLKIYPEKAEYASDLSAISHDDDINCQWITKVGSSSSRPKVLNCFEIGTPNGTYVFSVDSTEEREEWVESIRKSSMRQGTAKQVVAALQQRHQKKDISYETKVVGGVIQRFPIQSTSENSEGGPEGEVQATPTIGATAAEQHYARGKRTRGFPRIIKAGQGIKLGAVMKNWKKRFFVLTEISLGYYKSIEEVEPIKTISVGEICSVAPSKEIPGKDHLFEVVTPSRTFFVQVDSDNDMQDWVAAFNTLLKTIRHPPEPPTPQVRDLALNDSDDEPGTLV